VKFSVEVRTAIRNDYHPVIGIAGMKQGRKNDTARPGCTAFCIVNGLNYTAARGGTLVAGVRLTFRWEATAGNATYVFGVDKRATGRWHECRRGSRECAMSLSFL
jgi:hypothetical protein